MIRVAFDVRDPFRSGLGRLALSSARAFAHVRDGRFRVTWCGPSAALLPVRERDALQDVEVVDWRGARYSVQSLARWPRVRRDAHSDVWFFPHWDVPLGGVPRRSVVTVPDLTQLRMATAGSPMRRAIIRQWMAHAIGRARRVSVISNFTRVQLVEAWPDVESKVVVIPPGVNERFFTAPPPLPVEIRRFTDEGPFILSVGNRKRHKNLLMGVEVLSRVADLRWVVVGEDFPEWQEVERAIEARGLADRVKVLPPQPDEVVHALYGATACLFFPSRSEGFGLPLVEALSAGAPVVASRAGAIPETLGGFGELCEPDDAEGFAAAIVRAVAGGRDTSGAARRWAQRFTWRAGALRLARVFEDVAQAT